MVVDLAQGKIVGDIPETQGAHGVALAAEFNRGYTTNGRTADSTIFDMATLKVLGNVLDSAGPLARQYGNGKAAVELPIEEFMVPLATMAKSRFITARAAARHMVKQHSGLIIFVTGSPARPHVPGVTAIGAAFGTIENLTANLAFEVSPFGQGRLHSNAGQHR